LNFFTAASNIFGSRCVFSALEAHVTDAAAFSGKLFLPQGSKG